MEVTKMAVIPLSDLGINEQSPRLETKVIRVATPNDADDGDTFDIILSDVGITTVDGVIGFTHSTENNVIIQEQPTTAVSAGVLTITIGGSTDDKKRVFIIYGV